MSKTYKKQGGPPLPRGSKSRRLNAKGALKKVPKKLRDPRDSYNNLDLDEYDDGNFEKFPKRK